VTKVLLVDDHPMIGAALDMLLRDTGYELVGRARTAAEANSQMSRLKPDLLLLDVHLPDSSGLDVLQRLTRGRKRPKVILVTAGMDEAQLLAASDLEPEGIVLKTSDPGLLLKCMDAVVAGERWVDPEIAERTRQAQERAASAPPLTRRERELIDLVRQGLRNRDIAAELGVTEGTVKVYLHAIFDKLKVENRTELALRAGDLIGR
jgi:two-component system, NarL family, nitrate/nitrite response regulator NarL